MVNSQEQPVLGSLSSWLEFSENRLLCGGGKVLEAHLS
jgi:hypothetical protein